jgi:hypothetical protein
MLEVAEGGPSSPAWESTMRSSTLLTAAFLVGWWHAGNLAADEPRPRVCREHADLLKAIDEHLVHAEKAMHRGELPEASVQQAQVLEDLEKLLRLEEKEGGG